MNTRSSRGRALAVALAASAGVLALATHRPTGITLAGSDPTTGLVGACAWAAWLLCGYLLVAVAAASLRHLPRRPHAAAQALAGVSPRAVRRLVDAVVGATTVAAVLAGPAAAYADSPPAPRPSATASAGADLDWPGVASPPPVALVTAAPVRTPAAPPERLVVRAGDSLWSITARRLGPGASPARVAAEWPRLYAANRAVIGADPDLIHPGQHLTPPAAERRTTP